MLQGGEMGGAAQSSLKGWIPFGAKSVSSINLDPGLYILQLITGEPGIVSQDEIKGLYERQFYGPDVITSERFPEDLSIFVELLTLLQSKDVVVDKHEVLALVHKFNSPEKLMKSLFNLMTLKPLDIGAVIQVSEARLGEFMDKVLNARSLLLEGMITVIEAVHEAACDSASFPRWSHSVSFLARCKFAFFSLSLLKYINGFKTASETSLLADFMTQSDLSSLFAGDFEEMIVVLIVKFGFWLERKKLSELALMWLDSFDINVLATTAPINHELKAVLSYLRGTLSLGLERHDAADLLLEVSLLFPLEEGSKSYIRQFITNGESWNRLMFLKHCINVAAQQGQLSCMRELCAAALLCTDKNSTPSLMDLHVSSTSSQLECTLDISITYFQVLIELDSPEEAFSALSLMPQLFDKPKDCLHLLIDYLLEKKQWAPLFIKLPWGHWWDELKRVLETKQEYRLLFSLHSHRADYKSAANSLYLFALTERNLEEAQVLLLLAKQTLLLCNPDDSWFLHDNQVITVDDLEKEIVICQVQQFVFERVPGADINRLQDHLFEYGAYQLVLKLAKVLKQKPDAILVELAQELVFYQNSSSPFDPEALQWVELWLEGTECVLLDPTAAIGKIIRSCLQEYGPSSHLYGLVAETILTHNGRLPEWLKEDMLLTDISKLIRVLLNAGEVHEALRQAIEGISLSSSRLLDGKMNPDMISSGTLDALLSSVSPLERLELDEAWTGFRETYQRLAA